MSDENKPETETIQTAPDSFFDLKCKDIDGNWALLSKFKEAKVLLVVNVASLCTYTDSNYKQLDQIREEFKDKGLEVLAFPCNQFQSQEPGTHEDIRKFVN
jgi:glutathione peroxidase-family protein